MSVILRTFPSSLLCCGEHSLRGLTVIAAAATAFDCVSLGAVTRTQVETSDPLIQFNGTIKIYHDTNGHSPATAQRSPFVELKRCSEHQRQLLLIRPIVSYARLSAA